MQGKQLTRPIIVALDLSPASLVALEEAIPIAGRDGAEVVLAHATPMPENPPAYDWINPDLAESYRAMLEDNLGKTRSALASIREQHLEHGVEISISLLSGDAERVVPELAEQIDAQLIVVGSHGRTGIERVLLGSVAERMSRFTTRDVLVSRGEAAKSGYAKVLVATDFSETADRAFDRALELVAQDGKISLVHCIEVPPAVAGFYIADVMVGVDRACRPRAEALADRARAAGIKTDVIICNGHPISHLRELAGGHDLVVMGSHGRRGFRRFLLGSVAEKTIRHAGCSVYIARARLTESKGHGAE